MFSPTRRLLTILILLLLICQAVAAQTRPSAARQAVSSAGAKIYWSDAEIGTISRANLDGSGYEVLAIDPDDPPNSLALNVPAGSMYVIHGYPGGHWSIRQGDLDGQNMQTLTDLKGELWRPNSLAIDHTGDRIFWADSARDLIGHANLDGSDPAVQFLPGPEEPSSVAVDSVNGKLYWTDYRRIYRSNLDGSTTRRVAYNSLAELPIGIAVDNKNGKLYYTESHY